MLETYLVKGLLVGLVFGVPAGAIGALTIQRTLSHGFWAGMLTGLGSSAADVLYACVGVFGLTVVSDFLLTYQSGISLIGGGMIILLGVFIFRGKGGGTKNTEPGGTLPMFFASSFAIAIANPATILSFLVAFASFGIGDGLTSMQAAHLIVGILLGTGCWWGILSGITTLFRGRVTDKIYQVLNRLLGSLMALFGVAMVLRGLLKS